MTREEASKILHVLWVYYHRYFTEKETEAVLMAIEALKQPEQNPLSDKVCEETDDTDKLKFVAHKLDKLDEKIQQLEKDVDRLERSRTIEVRPVYPNITSTGISAYAGPEFGGGCTDSTDLTWTRTDEEGAK